MMIVTYY